MGAHRLKAGIRQGALLLIVGTMLGAASNAVRSDRLPWKGPWSPSTRAASLLRGLQEISPNEAWSLYKDGQALFLDARDPLAFKEGHFPGALNVPPEDAEDFVDEVNAFVEAGMRVIAYCDGLDCPSSPELARALQSHGVPSVEVMVDGWSRWREAGFPVEKETQ